MNPYPTTPDEKRAFAESCRHLDVDQALLWLGVALAQENGKLDAYGAALQEWQRQRPNPMSFASEDGQREYHETARRWHDEARAKFMSLWGRFLEEKL